MPGETTVTGTVISGTHDTGAGNWQNKNDPTLTSELLGKDVKLALPTHGYWRFHLPDLPRRSKITSAFLRITAETVSYGNPFNAVLRFIVRDGKWNRPSHDDWVGIPTHDLKLQVADSGTVTRIDTLSSTTDMQWDLRFNANHFQKLGQRFTNTGSSFTLGSAKLELSKVGSPTGEVGLEVYQVNIFLGRMNPGDAPIAVSSGINVASIGGTKSLHRFDFIGPNQITISNDVFLRQYIVTLTGTYPPSSTHYVRWHGRANGQGTEYANGYALTSGIGFQFDQQNYPDDQSLPYGAFFAFGSSATWPLPAMVAGGSYESPDISLLVQEAINDSQYDDDGNVVALSFDTNLASAGDRIRIAMFEHATLKAPELVVTYKPRRAYVVM